MQLPVQLRLATMASLQKYNLNSTSHIEETMMFHIWGAELGLDGGGMVRILGSLDFGKLGLGLDAG